MFYKEEKLTENIGTIFTDGTHTKLIEGIDEDAIAKIEDAIAKIEDAVNKHPLKD